MKSKVSSFLHSIVTYCLLVSNISVNTVYHTYVSYCRANIGMAYICTYTSLSTQLQYLFNKYFPSGSYVVHDKSSKPKLQVIIIIIIIIIKSTAKLNSTEMDFWRRSARISRKDKIRNNVINLLKPNDIYIYMSCRSANLQTLHFKYLFNKYAY